ncbi:hypothetical protein [Catellatospora tritici]|uniref:hypothetical protein n=1 Tax=Catellatospora tritici TaxID=2851566 RepID=UPI001C2D97EB|nr:hypothetical protein [Catellatospora tritici]MBV1853658.1 hypothetical protein [Catellatospora tritici]
MTDLAECISRSCTTGWLDWIHGELWLSPTGLLRRRLTLAQTRANGLGPTVTAPLPRADLGGATWQRIVAEHRTNKAIAFAEIAQARLVTGITTDALRLRQHSGVEHRLLWLKADPAYEILSRFLPEVLGERLATLPPARR